jgi:8-oxo-dGTP diphosphatase
VTGWDGSDFSGAKLAARCGDAILVYTRDRRADIPFPGLIDLPGGGREGDESPAECALRELAEEFGLTVAAERIDYSREYELSWNRPVPSYFLGVELTAAEIAAIRFGDEGEDGRLMGIAEFLRHPAAVPHLQDRVAMWLFDNEDSFGAGYSPWHRPAQ